MFPLNSTSHGFPTPKIYKIVSKYLHSALSVALFPRHPHNSTPSTPTRDKIQDDTIIMDEPEMSIEEDEEDSLYQPTWLLNSGGFIDYRSNEAANFNELLNCFLPKQVNQWDCDETGWTFEFYQSENNSTTNSSLNIPDFLENILVPLDLCLVSAGDAT